MKEKWRSIKENLKREDLHHRQAAATPHLAQINPKKEQINQKEDKGKMKTNDVQADSNQSILMKWGINTFLQRFYR
jgi:hypothetical protein